MKPKWLLIAFLVVAFVGMALLIAGISMPDDTLQETLLVWPGFFMYFGGMASGWITMAVMRKEDWDD
jgi:Sec-independent protein secretion pathway component TatC